MAFVGARWAGHPRAPAAFAGAGCQARAGCRRAFGRRAGHSSQAGLMPGQPPGGQGRAWLAGAHFCLRAGQTLADRAKKHTSWVCCAGPLHRSALASAGAVEGQALDPGASSHKQHTHCRKSSVRLKRSRAASAVQHPNGTAQSQGTSGTGQPLQCTGVLCTAVGAWPQKQNGQVTWACRCWVRMAGSSAGHVGRRRVLSAALSSRRRRSLLQQPRGQLAPTCAPSGSTPAAGAPPPSKPPPPPSSVQHSAGLGQPGAHGHASCHARRLPAAQLYQQEPPELPGAHHPCSRLHLRPGGHRRRPAASRASCPRPCHLVTGTCSLRP